MRKNLNFYKEKYNGKINVLSDLALNGSLTITQNNIEFPENPEIGTVILKEQVLYAYITIGGLSTWYPFSTKTNSYIHTQGLESSAWTINHGLGTTDVWFQVHDIYGRIMMPAGITPVDENSFIIDFSEASMGTAIIVGPDTVSAPLVQTSLIDVNNGTVVIDSTGIKVNGEYITPASSQTGGADNAIIPIETDVINCALGSYFTKTVSTTTTFSFSNVPSNVAFLVTVIIDHTSGTINWPPAVSWPESVAPTLTNGKTHIFNFLTDDGGTTWRGSSLVNYS